MDDLDSLLEVEGVSESSSKSDDCGLVWIEDLGMLVLLVLGVLGIVLGKLGVDDGGNGVLGVEGTLGITAISGILCGPLMVVR